MAQVSTEQLLARLASGKAIPAVLLLGEEPYLRDGCRARLIEKFVPEAARTWAVSRYSAGRGETQAALDQAQTMAMLSPQQVVFLEDAEAIEKLGEKNRDEAVAQMTAYLNDPAPFTVLVVEATGLDQRMKLGKLLAEKTLVVSCGLGEEAAGRQAAAVAVARTIGKEKGVEFEKGAAEDLAEFVAADLMRLKTEIEKLATFAGEKKFIGRNDVISMVISEKTTTVWELADLLAARKSPKALEFLDRLLRDGEEPLSIVGAMAWMYRKLIEASEVRGVTNGYQAARALGMRPEQAELALQAARKIPKAQLLAALGARQKAQSLTRFHRRPRQNDAVHLLRQQRAHRHGHGDIGLPRSTRPDTEHHVVLFDLFHVPPLAGVLRRDLLLPKRARSCRFKHPARRLVRLFRGHAHQRLHFRARKRPPMPRQVVILLDDFHRLVDALLLTLDGQPRVVQMCAHAQRILQQTHILVERAEERFDFSGYVYGTSHPSGRSAC